MKSSRTAPKFPRRILAALLVVGFGSAACPAFAEYKLQPGDTLEISVMSIQGLKQRALIGMEGEISLPLDGQIKVSGLTVAAAGARIAQRLANKVFLQPGADGRDISHLILPDEVAVTVAEYRPVYVNGDVAKPGEYAYRPGMTVRQAIAVAGGYGLTRLGMVDPNMQTADLQAEHETLSTQLAREQAQAWRLRSELGALGSDPAAKPAPAPVPTPASQLFMKGETQQYEARIADREQDATFLRTAIDKASLQLKVLAEKKKEIETGNRADVADFDKLKDLSSRGLTTAMRLSETRRLALLSSDELRQTIVDMSNIERQRSDYVRQLDKLNGQIRVDDLKELENSEMRIAEITARLRSVEAKMTYVGMMRSQLADTKAARPTISVHRVGENGTKDLAAGDNDLPLAPGDIVDVTLPNDRSAKLVPGSSS